jgi:hypothetical protein
MPHIQFILDGETVYDEHVKEWLAPPKPDMIPADVRRQANPNAKPPPYMKALMLAMIGKAVAANLRDPRLAPLDVDLKPHATGFTLAVNIPAPDATDGEPEPAPQPPPPVDPDPFAEARAALVAFNQANGVKPPPHVGDFSHG